MVRRDKRNRALAVSMAALITASSVLGGTGNIRVVSAADAIVSVTDVAQMYGKDVTFDPTSTWDDKGEYAIALSTDAALKDGAKITLEILIPKDATFEGTMKFQGAVKVGDAWAWTEFASIPEFTIDDFKEDGDYKKVEVTYTGEALTVGAIKEFDIKAAGYQCDYSGAIYVRNVEMYDGEEASSTNELLASITDTIQMYEKDVTFDPTSTWDDKGEQEFAITTEGALKSGAYITMDVMIPSDATFEGILKLQGVVKVGDDWTWTEFASIPELTDEDFVVDGDYKKATVTYTGEPLTVDAVRVFIVKAAGYQCDYSGSIYLTNICLYDGTDEAGEAGGVGEVITTLEDRIQMYEKDVTFDPTSTWDDKGEQEFAITTDGALKNGAQITMEVLIPKDATYNGSIKFQGVVKLGEKWAWTEFSGIPELKAEDFTEEDGDYKKVVLTYTGEALTTDAVQVFIVKAAGYECDYSGPIYVQNVTLYDGSTSGGTVLAPKDPTILSELATEEDFANWDTEEGWDYYHGGDKNTVPEIAYDSENQRLQVTVDYSANSASTWSEAKVKYTPEEAVDVSQYNQLSVDIIYPDELDGTKMKFFADGIMNKDCAIDETEAEDLGNGMKKVTVTMGFSPSTTPLKSVTIGIIGVSTSFQGDVYLDNLILSQKNEAEDFIEITETVGEGSPADISKAPTTVTLADANADDSAVALFTYLQALANSDQVLFGHQNDVSRSVNASAELGDVYDVTGQVSGMFGIDSLSLTGTEAGGTDAESAMANSIAYSKEAAENGAIITLSTHMPNFTNEKVIKNEDGTYDFFNCDFSESKDLSNDVAQQILPGGEYNEAFNAYLDIIAEYALALQEDNIPVIFRPLHENTGNWFWWGSSNTPETYKSLFRYTKDYLEAQGVHNMLYVYSPGGPIASEEEYLIYYPGDEYVDILAFDYYDDYNTYPATSDGSFFTHLDETCQVVSSLAEKRGKLASISECGVRVMKKDGSDNEGLLVKGNPVGTEASGTNWYQEISDIAQKNNMPYYLVWANFSDTNFYVPYKYNDTYGQELINDFIQYYNDDSSIFGDDANFYENIEALGATATEDYTTPSGYMVYPFDMGTILEPTTISASVKNATAVQFVIEDSIAGTKVTLDATESETADLYEAALTEEVMTTIGKTDVATITLLADGEQLAQLTNISLGQEKAKAPANVLEDFDYYSGSNGLLDANYTSNSAAGCSSSFVLSEEYKNGGSYGGAFVYTLVTTGSEVWTGRIKSDLVSGDFSEYNAIEMWVKPDGKGQKLVIQLTDASGEEFEVYLSDFVKGTEAQYVTIPFSSFKGKKNGTLDTANITKFAVWCNSIIPEDYTGTWTVDSTIYFDGIQAVSLSEDVLEANPVDDNGLIITDDSLTATPYVNPFKDVADDAWYAKSVQYVVEKGLFTGTSADKFSPNTAMTRGMLVTVLYRAAGRPEVTDGKTYSDVPSSKYYASAIAWASSIGMATGYSDGTFRPEDPVTREQVAKILYHYSKYMGEDVTAKSDITTYRDYYKISGYAVKYMEWAAAENVITGHSNKLNPKGNATRAEVASMLNRLMEN